MTFENPYFTAVLLILLGLHLLDIVADLLNLSALQREAPAPLRDLYDRGRQARANAYTVANTRFGIVSGTFSLAVFLIFWLSGGFGWLDGAVRSWGFGPVGSGLAAVGVLAAASALLSLPFEVYDTFVLEERFGFNRTTPKTFVLDYVKGTALAVLLGAPLLALVLYLFGRFEHAWLYAWAAVSGFSLLMTYLAPRLLLPLFNKFSPLEDGELKRRIHALGERCGFPVGEVSVMDGSRRSSKANAFFTGFGKHKRIALFDTLVENHSTDELVAVLAHEIGHFRKHHIVQQIAVGVLHTGVLFFLLGLMLDNAALFAAFGVAEPSVYFGLVFFGVLFKPVNRLLSVGMAVLSRRNEFQADAYAAEVTGSPEALGTALKKLSAENLANLTPHRFYVFMHYSHPPLAERLRALSAAPAATAS